MHIEIKTFMGQQGEADRETDKQINQHAVFTYSMIQGYRSGFFKLRFLGLKKPIKPQKSEFYF